MSNGYYCTSDVCIVDCVASSDKSSGFQVSPEAAKKLIISKPKMVTYCCKNCGIEHGYFDPDETVNKKCVCGERIVINNERV